ncbi:MAG: nickel transporter [Aliifodinibius sp.]|nr:nickel transporter [candidate division Zixibacteria bacterium]NIT56637.1 nickel transporter [Fodinibius sp.]NIY25220.1 nickel transporter [Fodinibius sp.]
MQALIALVTGGIAGIIHVLTGPDHLAAVTPFTVDKRSRAWLVGLLWGVGHTAGVWTIGVLVFLFKEMLPVDLLSAWSERLVGAVLVVLGIWGIRRGFTTRLHYHEHKHDGDRHAHFHLHSPESSHKKKHSHTAHHHSHAPFGIGSLHGLAGSSHLIGVLPALALSSQVATIMYVVGYGVGSIAAMTAFSWVMGKFVQRMLIRSIRAYNYLLISFALMAIGVGVFWLVMI